MTGLMASEGKVQDGVPQQIQSTAVADYATGPVHRLVGVRGSVPPGEDRKRAEDRGLVAGLGAGPSSPAGS